MKVPAGRGTTTGLPPALPLFQERFVEQLSPAAEQPATDVTHFLPAFFAFTPRFPRAPILQGGKGRELPAAPASSACLVVSQQDRAPLRLPRPLHPGTKPCAPAGRGHCGGGQP